VDAKKTAELSDLNLDSTYLIAFEMAYGALRAGLACVSGLNVMQYHALVKVYFAGEHGLTQTDIGVMLDLKPNVVTATVDALEASGYAQRVRRSDGDGRIKAVLATPAGMEHIAQVNSSVVEQLYTIFPTQDDFFRSILEASIAAGANIDPLPPESTDDRFQASRALLSISLIRRTIEQILRRLAQVSFYEYRALQRLCEVDTPLRIGDLANQLRIPTPTISRAVNQLVEREWVNRFTSPRDKKALFVAATEAGARRQKLIAETIDSLAHSYLWKNLTPEQRNAIAQAGHVVIAQLQEREQAQRQAALDLLVPKDG
jgi:DNA-binding MarR family transcriptional regulator